MKYGLALVLILLGVGASILLFQLASHPSVPEGTPAAAPKVQDLLESSLKFQYSPGEHGGQFRNTMSADLQTFNAVLSTDATSSSILGWMYHGLLDRNRATYAWEPRLAAAMPEKMDEEGLVWDVRLREDVRWFDGAPLTADDVVFTINRIIYNETILTSWRYSWELEDTDPETGRQIKRKVKVEKMEPYRVRFTLPYKWAYFHEALGTEIMPRHALEQAVDEGRFNEKWNLQTPPHRIVGCGPYKIKSYRFNERLVLERNRDYFRKNQFEATMPLLDEIVYTVIQDPGVARDNFNEGLIDTLSVRGLDFISMYHRQKSANYTIYRRGPGTGTRFLVFNMNGRKKADGTPFIPPHKLAWFRDRRFRRAVAHAMDRDRIRKTIFHGFAYTQNSPVSEANTRFFSGGRTDGEFSKYPLVIYDFNLKKANALLDEMGMTGRDAEGYRTQADANGETHRVEFLINTYAQSPEYQKIASIMKDDLKAVGIKVNAQQIPFAALVRKLMREWDWETIIIGLTGGYSDPMNGGRNVWPTTGNLHMWNPRQKDLSTAFEWEKELNSLFEQAQKTPSEADRQLLAARFQHIVTREVPLIYTVQSESITAVRNRFGNFNPSVYSLVDYMMIFDRNAKLMQH